MSNLEELTLDITNRDRTQIHDGILVHMPRLNKFTFHITTLTRRQHIMHQLSNNDIQQTFTNIGNEQVGCIVNYAAKDGKCHIFSLPFIRTYLHYVRSVFPSIIFHPVKRLGLSDVVPFEHEFFLRIARCFSSPTTLTVSNETPQSHLSDVLDSNGNRLYSIVEYPHLTSLTLLPCHVDSIMKLFVLK